jgi:hypothetical protein
MATLGDLGPQPFAVAPAGEAPVTAPADRWLVLVGNDGPVSALPPGATLGAGARPPGIVVAGTHLDLAAVLRSEAFKQLTGVSGLVLVEPASDTSEPSDSSDHRIAGVVSVASLVRVIQRGTTRSITGTELPGVADIPWISRSCGFTAGGVLCATSMPFLSQPYPMPACRNERHLTAHSFVW